MVKRILGIFHKEISGLHQAAYLLGFFALCSQILALVRDRILASQFGATSTLDLYYAAFRIPDFIFITVGSMVSVSVLIPFIIERSQKDGDGGKKFISNIFSFFFLFIVATCAVVFFFVPSLCKYLFPGFDPSNLSQVISLTRVLLLSPIFLGLSNIFGTLTQARKRFFLFALSPIFYNLAIIAGIIYLYPKFGLIGLVYGVILGAFFHFAIQIPFVIQHGICPKFEFKYNWSDIKKVLFISVPRTFTLGSDNISMMFLISFASLMTAGSIAVFNFSFNLQSVPLTIIGVSYSLAAFPILIQTYLSGDLKKFTEQMINSARHIIFWSVPIVTLFIVLRAQIVRTILGAGHFNWYNTRLTAAALAIFAASIIFQNLTLLFVRAYYAAGNTKKPLIAKGINALFTVALGYGFMVLYTKSPLFKDIMETALRVKDIPGTIILTLPLGWSIGEFFNMVVLWTLFQKDFKGFSKKVMKTFFQIFTASSVMGFVAYNLLNIFDKVFDLDTMLGIFMQGFLAGLGGIFAGVLVLCLFKNEELKDVWNTLHKKIFKPETSVIGPDAEMQ
ncbi:MAG: lipid II flippase MurJ [Patescibacteria group bacterium]